MFFAGRKLLISIFLILALFLSVLLCLSEDGNCNENNYYLIEMNEVFLSYRQYLPGSSDPLINDNSLPNRLMDKGIDLSVNLNLFRYLYWENTVVSLTDKGANGENGQFRLVGWNYRLGVNLTDYLQVGYYHFSKHLLDTTVPFSSGFPVQDAVEVKINLFRRDGITNGNHSIF